MRTKVRVKRLIAAGSILVIIIGTIAVSVYFLFFNKPSIYKQYVEEDKTVGVIENYEQDVDDFYISIFYPNYKIDTLDKQIKQYYEDSIKEEKAGDTKNTLYMDYSTKKILDQYINVELKFQRFDDEDQPVSNKNKIFTFDAKLNKTLTVEDLFRGKYINFLKEKGVDTIDIKSTALTIDDKNIYLYPDEKNISKKITIPFEECKDYLALNNTTINPTAPEAVAVKEPQEIDASKKMVAITFDDGPHVSNTQRILDLFEKYDGRATFFMLGKLVEKYPDVVKDVYARGFEVANHSWDHANLPKQTMDKVTSEIYDTQTAIYKITGKEPTLFRPPYGAYNPAIKAESMAGNVGIMLWTGDTLDWKTREANAVKDAIIRDARDGGIILLHDIHSTSVDGLELALPILKEQGYQFVTVDTLKQYREVKDW